MLMTIRAYNPKLKNVAYGEETSVVVTNNVCGVVDSVFCCYCYLTKHLVNDVFKEHVHYACDGKKTI